MTEQPESLYDVAILGGGAAGLTLALQLHRSRPETSILVVEKQRHPAPEAAHKVGESTVEIAGHYLRSVLGLEEHLREHQLAKFGLRMFFSHGDNEDIAERIELGHGVRPPHGVGTYQLDRGRLENFLAAELSHRGVPFRAGCTVQEVCLRPDHRPHRLRLRTGGTREEEEVDARWVVDATGRSSLLKRQLGLGRTVDHRANAVWFRIAHPIDIEDWSTDPEWGRRIREGRREFSTNHLMGPGYWVWLIRLSSDSISIGIVTDGTMHVFNEMNRLERAISWLRTHEPQCARVVERHRDRVRDFRVMRNYSYGCEQVFSDQRWCLVGESGVFLDPLYSPGLDLIAIGNGLTTDLISHALDGDDVEERAAIHNQMFLVLSEGWRRVYEQQYPLMGNARIMLVKVVWDTAVYWAVPGLLHFQDAIRRLAEFPTIIANLARFSAVSERLQLFLREWHELDRSDPPPRFVGFYDVEFMAGLHVGMTAGLTDAELEARFAANVRFIEQISGQLVSTVVAELAADPSNTVARRQVERWRADETLMHLVAIHEHDGREHPIDDDWIRGTARDRAVSAG